MAGAAPVFPSLRFAHARGFAHRLAIGWGPLGAPSRPTWVGTAAEPRCRRARGHFFISIASVAQTLQRTPLFDRHVALGARMVPFAGWEMPVQYDGVIPEHRAVRGDCGVFDVSHMGEIEVEGMVNRTGYTGETGVELMCPAEDAPALWDAVVARGAKPCGLGARDTLRLEVCYPLHGNDITQETDAISAGLGWTCALDKDFTGADELRRIKEHGPERKLVAFVMEEKAIPRQGMAIEGGGEV